jgi:hypothetical protein
MNKLLIFSDNAIEASWFKSLSKHFKNVESEMIKSRGRNPDFIEKIIQYDRPDIILSSGEKILLVVEKTREVPTGHNVGQRVARLVRAAEDKIPTIKFFPFDAKKHGEFANICNMNIRLLLAFERMWSIHSTPIIALNWIADSDGELFDDGSEDNEIRTLINDFIESGYSSTCAKFLELRQKTVAEYKKRLIQRPQYASPPPSVSFQSTNSFLRKLRFEVSDIQSARLRTKEESLVYAIGMSEEKCKRQDPYTGMQFIYDYAYCRSGERPEQKSKNLILHFPSIRKAVWEKKNPNNPMTKSCNWYLVANALVFSDGIQILR